MILVLLFISFKCRRGGMGLRNPENFADILYGWSLINSARSKTEFDSIKDSFCPCILMTHFVLLIGSHVVLTYSTSSFGAIPDTMKR